MCEVAEIEMEKHEFRFAIFGAFYVEALSYFCHSRPLYFFYIDLTTLAD